DVIHLFDPASGKEVRRVQKGASPDSFRGGSLTLSPDGSLLAVPHGSAAVIAEAESGRVLGPVEAPGWLLARLALSGEGKLCAMAPEGFRGTFSVVLWDVPLRQKRRTLDLSPGRSGDVALSPDGKVLATWAIRVGRAPAIQLWDVNTGKELGELS